MTTTADPCEILERKVGQRVRDDESHRRLAEALSDVAVAAIHPARHLGLGRAVSQGMLEDPIESATHAAVEVLITAPRRPRGVTAPRGDRAPRR